MALRRASFGESHWYTASDFQGFSARLGNLPSAAVGAGVAWEAPEGAIGAFWPPLPHPSVAYTRRSPDGGHACGLPASTPICDDFFYDGPGPYAMSFLEQSTTFDDYVAAWSDVRAS